MMGPTMKAIENVPVMNATDGALTVRVVMETVNKDLRAKDLRGQPWGAP